jgi:hypothetical protein
MTSHRAKVLIAFFVTYVASPLAAQQALSFYTITPCRIVDTRDGQGPLVGSFDRLVPVGNHCGIPGDAVSAALNFTAIAPNAQGWFSAYPFGTTPPGTTVVGFQAGVTRASNAAIKLNANGQMAVLLAGPFASQASRR